MPGFWDDQGGHAAAGIAKTERLAKAAAKKKTAVGAADERWKSMLSASQNAQNAHSEQAAAEVQRKAASPHAFNDDIAASRVDAAATRASCNCQLLFRAAVSDFLRLCSVLLMWGAV